MGKLKKQKRGDGWRGLMTYDDLKRKCLYLFFLFCIESAGNKSITAVDI